MRKILVLGATGGTGRQIVSQAAQQGYEVTVLVRNSQRASGIADSARVLAGDVLDGGQALDGVMRGQDAVISALGVGNSLRSSGLIAASVPAIVGAMERHGVRRLIFTSAYGVGETRAQVPTLPRLLMGVLLRDIYADKAAGDARPRDRTLPGGRAPRAPRHAESLARRRGALPPDPAWRPHPTSAKACSSARETRARIT